MLVLTVLNTTICTNNKDEVKQSYKRDTMLFRNWDDNILKILNVWCFFIKCLVCITQVETRIN